MKSIRSFLIIAIVSTITLIIFLSALNGYRDSLAKAEQLFDSELLNKAHLLASAFAYTIDANNTTSTKIRYTKHRKTEIPATRVALKNEVKEGTLESVFIFQIWQGQQLLLRSFNAPDLQMAQFIAGFHYKNIADYRWRTLSYYSELSDVWIITAERVDIRYILAENIVLETILPAILMLPVVAFLIWFIIHYGLSPLKQLALTLSNKRADDLSPLPVTEQPAEVTPLVSSVNDLLYRLKTSFLREKRFASDAAHELRTPISAIKVHLHNLSCSVVPCVADHNFQQLSISVERMEHLVEQILNLNRISPEQYMAQFKELDLYLLAQELIIREYSAFNNKNLKIELQGEHCKINGDLLSLEVLLQNLLSNACKYTPEGGSVLVSICCDQNTKGGLIQVQNTGSGVPEEQYERVFDRFYRSNGDRHDSGSSGCGLGLAIVKQIAELHHADIVVSQAHFSAEAQKKGFMVSVTFE